MRITSVEFHPQGSSVIAELSFRDPTRLNQYNIKGITGLDADEIVGRAYGVPGVQDFLSQMMVKKEVVALIELNPDYGAGKSPSSLRDDLYRMIASSRKGKIDIWFKNAAVVVATLSGSVTKFEASLFTDTPEVQITIKCTEPFLKAPARVSKNVVGLDPSLTVIQDPLSTAPHGFKFELKVKIYTASLIFKDPDDASWAFTVTPLTGFNVNDVIYFSSEYNSKYLYLIRSAATIYLADVIQSGSVWPIMFPGDTKLAITTGINVEWNAISYYPTYWGV